MRISDSHPLNHGGGGARYRSRRRGQAIVEFALAAPVLILVVWGIVVGSWFVFETSAVTNAARQAVRWEAAAQNYQTPVGGVAAPYCALSTSNVPPAMVQAAQVGSGPLSASIGTGITNTALLDSSGDVIGCKVVVSVPFTSLTVGVKLGPSTISSTATASRS